MGKSGLCRTDWFTVNIRPLSCGTELAGRDPYVAEPPGRGTIPMGK